MATKYKARQSYDEAGLREVYWVEKTDERYGFPAVAVPQQPRFTSFNEAEDYARKLNDEAEQLKLF